ncbi:hypothetical protein RND81_08G017500 [Saponaria officinalis]|uniref:BHLH domain-containing protein n=1 Tax=Saponaria officinalis TaxID=3572 RepID=A0AAW1J2P8_SAPOF
MEGGEWSNFNAGVCVNEEADFMAQLFPNPNDVNNVRYGNNYNQMVNSNINNNNGSSYYSSDSSSSNYYQQQTSYRNPHVVGYYQMEYFSDNSHYNHENNNDNCLVTPASNAPPLPIDFLQCRVEDDNNDAKDNGDDLEESPIDDDEVVDVKTSDSSESSKKRLKSSNVQNKKRNVKAKKSQKLTLGDDDDDDNEGPINRQGSITESLDDDDCSSKGTSIALNSNGKTRASRGSATDPQSLYARKRRERINERLKILQTLVPNGTKVDISTMLEEAVHYVKFLQLQIKLLSSDEMWMYAPIAYNGMNLGLDFNNITIPR